MKYPSVLKAYNLYQLVGLENYASGEKLKKRYWQLAHKHHPVESSEPVCQHRKIHKCFYFATMAVDNEFNRFIDEFRCNFTKFLKHCKKLKSRPKVVSKDNITETAFEGYLENGLSRFKDSN